MPTRLMGDRWFFLTGLDRLDALGVDGFHHPHPVAHSLDDRSWGGS